MAIYMNIDLRIVSSLSPNILACILQMKSRNTNAAIAVKAYIPILTNMHQRKNA